MMLWLVHDEVLFVMPHLAPMLSVFTLPFAQMFIVTSCVYSFSSWITDNLYKCFTKVNAPDFSSPQSYQYSEDSVKKIVENYLQQKNPDRYQDFDIKWGKFVGQTTN